MMFYSVPVQCKAINALLFYQIVIVHVLRHFIAMSSILVCLFVVVVVLALWFVLAPPRVNWWCSCLSGTEGSYDFLSACMLLFLYVNILYWTGSDVFYIWASMICVCTIARNSQNLCIHIRQHPPSATPLCQKTTTYINRHLIRWWVWYVFTNVIFTANGNQLNVFRKH